jgi:hypothetical protein
VKQLFQEKKDLFRLSVNEERIQNRVQLLKQIEEAARRAQSIYEAKRRNEETLLEKLRI